MKPIMRKRFVPNHYNREVYNRLQSLSQGSKTVNEYFKKIKITIIRANISKDREVTFARFFIGLNKDIANVVELQYYLDQRYGAY
jgi:hypothetical protein